MARNTIKYKSTLTELESDDWGEPGFPSYLVTTVYAVRKKPLDQLTVEELRLAIGEQMSLRFLLPLAIERLRQDPMVAGHLYPGDLLRSVIQIDADYWLDDPDSWKAVVEIGEPFWRRAELEEPWYSELEQEIREEFQRFLSAQPPVRSKERGR